MPQSEPKRWKLTGGGGVGAVIHALVHRAQQEQHVAAVRRVHVGATLPLPLPSLHGGDTRYYASL